MALFKGGFRSQMVRGSSEGKDHLGWWDENELNFSIFKKLNANKENHSAAQVLKRLQGKKKRHEGDKSNFRWALF